MLQVVIDARKVRGHWKQKGTCISFSSDTEPVLFLFTRTIVNVFSRTRETLFTSFHISLASDSLARVGPSPRQPLGPCKCIENVSWYKNSEDTRSPSSTECIISLLHISMADRGARNPEGSLSWPCRYPRSLFLEGQVEGTTLMPSYSHTLSGTLPFPQID